MEHFVISGFIEASFPSENIKTIFISKYPVSKTGASPTSWQLYDNPSLQGHRASVCYTRIQKVMLRKNLFKAKGRVTWTDNRDVQRAPWLPVTCWCNQLMGQGRQRLTRATERQSSIQAEVGTNIRRDDYSFLLYLLTPLHFSIIICVYYREIYNAIALFLILQYWGAVLCCLGQTWRVTDQGQSY